MNLRSTSPAVLITVGILLLFAASAAIGMLVAYDSSLGRPVLLAILVSLGLFFVVANAVVSPWLVSKVLVVVAGLAAV
jgi:hypothetical protein